MLKRHALALSAPLGASSRSPAGRCPISVAWCRFRTADQNRAPGRKVNIFGLSAGAHRKHPATGPVQECRNPTFRRGTVAWAYELFEPAPA